METPKPKPGRPRRRPFAAHQARGVQLRARNAASALRAFRWRLDASPEVAAYWQADSQSWAEWLAKYGPLAEECLDRLCRVLDDPSVPAEGC